MVTFTFIWKSNKSPAYLLTHAPVGPKEKTENKIEKKWENGIREGKKSQNPRTPAAVACTGTTHHRSWLFAGYPRALLLHVAIVSCWYVPANARPLMTPIYI
jgi:hypothetical protein